MLRDQADAGVEFALKILAEAPAVDWPWHWWAFGELSTERQMGMGTGPIPYSAIRDLADEFTLLGNERSSFLYIVRGLDTHYLTHIAADQKKNLEKHKR